MTRLKVLPIGWNHALWRCHILHRRILEVRGGLSLSLRVVDRGPAPSLGPWCYAVYVDDAIFVDADAAAAQLAMKQGLAAARDAGLPVREVTPATQTSEVLEWYFGRHRSLVFAKPARVWRLSLALDWLLSAFGVELGP